MGHVFAICLDDYVADGRGIFVSFFYSCGGDWPSQKQKQGCGQQCYSVFIFWLYILDDGKINKSFMKLYIFNYLMLYLRQAKKKKKGKNVLIHPCWLQL